MKDLRAKPSVPLPPDEQLTLWLAGTSKCPNDNGECCPDFSCCKPGLLAPVEQRAAFVAADQRGREGMLGGFLAGLVATTGVRAHIIGAR